MSDVPIQPQDSPKPEPPHTDAAPPEASPDTTPDVKESPVAVQVAEQQPVEPTGANPAAAQEDSTASKPAPVEDTPKLGNVYAGKVLRVTNDDVFVDLDGKHQGSVPMIEFAGQPLPRENDELNVRVERVDADKKVLLTKIQAEELAFWQSVKPGDELDGVVTGMNKGGLDLDIGGARAFLPTSQVDTHHLKDISTLIGEHVKCVVTQVDRATQDLVVSRRKFLERELKQQRAEVLNSLAEGQKVTGRVKNITDYGAFIELGGGVDGLLHVTDMSWGRVRHPKDFVEPGQELEVTVLKIDREKKKVSLGLKQIKPDPWSVVQEKYIVGEKVKGKVLRLADFGAFVELEEGIEALLPLSEMSWSRRIGHPSEIVKVGDEPEAVVLKVDLEKRRISLGLKQNTENPWANVETKYALNSKVQGKVTRIADFGAFVELEPGVEGMMHISELSEKRVATVGDVVKEGQDVEVRVIKLDLKAQKISLSMRPEATAPPVGEDTGKPGKPKKRKKPLRGGLSAHFDWF